MKAKHLQDLYFNPLASIGVQLGEKVFINTFHCIKCNGDIVIFEEWIAHTAVLSPCSLSLCSLSQSKI